MAREYKVLVIDSSAPPAPVEATLESLKDAILGNPTLALDALRYALQQGAETPPVTPPIAPGVPISGDLPLDTPIFKMMSSDHATILTPNASRLTKEDLLDLAGVGLVKKTPESLNLSVADLKSIQDAFHAQFTTEAAGLQIGPITITKCCCTPCCTCTAASVPEAIRRAA